MTLDVNILTSIQDNPLPEIANAFIFDNAAHKSRAAQTRVWQAQAHQKQASPAPTPSFRPFCAASPALPPA
jgi:hypothetical protein